MNERFLLLVTNMNGLVIHLWFVCIIFQIHLSCFLDELCLYLFFIIESNKETVLTYESG
jgi:hypothetical protein